MDQKLRVGRLLRGQRDEDFLTLSADPGRQFVFLFDYKKLLTIKNQLQVSWLDVLGYPQEFKDQLVQAGYQFKLIHFLLPQEALLATWHNLSQVLSQIGYPDLAEQLNLLGYDQLSHRNKDKLQQLTRINQCFQGTGYLYNKEWPQGLSCHEYLCHNKRLKELKSCDFTQESWR